MFFFHLFIFFIFVASAGTSFPSLEPWTCVTLTFADFYSGVALLMVSNPIFSGDGVEVFSLAITSCAFSSLAL